jgi:hypothetical protein
MKEIKIKEEFQIPGTDIILESGDRIEIKEEFVDASFINHYFNGDYELAFNSLTTYVQLEVDINTLNKWRGLVKAGRKLGRK